MKKIIKFCLKFFTDESGLYWLKEIDLKFLYNFYFRSNDEFEYIKIKKKSYINLNLIKDLEKFYKINIKKFDKKNIASEWLSNIETIFESLFSSLNSGNSNKTEEILHNMMDTSLMHGLDYGNYLNKKNIKAMKLNSMFKLHGICQYLNLNNSLSDEGKNNLLSKKDYLSNLNIIKKRYDFKFFNSSMNNYQGLKIGENIFNASDIQSLYSAIRIKETINQHFEVKKKLNIVEIGGGYGKTALSHYMINKDKINQIFLIDLLPMSILQIYYFSKNMDIQKIWFPGCKRNYNKCKIIIIPTDSISFLDNFNIDLYFNENSFPEMKQKELDKYICQFKKNGRYLFSMNHETNTTSNQYVHASISDSVKKFKAKLIDRRKNWLRVGYFESIFKNS